MFKSITFISATILASLLLLAVVGCTTTSSSPTEPAASLISTSGPDTGAVKREVIVNYADGVHALYAKSLTSATAMDQAIELFLREPTASSLEGAKRAWLRARDDYSPTEAFRFYGGPIDNEDDGPEGLINAWPLDESYIDYVEGDLQAGIINNP